MVISPALMARSFGAVSAVKRSATGSRTRPRIEKAALMETTVNRRFGLVESRVRRNHLETME